MKTSPAVPDGSSTRAMLVDFGADHGFKRDTASSVGVTQDEEWKVVEPQDALKELQMEFDDTQRFAAQAELDGAVDTFHHVTMKRWMSELDTLLVYAGLFSAVLTAFNVESYRLLTPDVESTAAAFRRVSGGSDRLAAGRSAATDFAVVRGEISSSATPATFVVWVNCLWFSSLVISLASASIALLVKQWLYESNADVSGESRASTQLLQFRMDSLKRWNVRRITMLVPVLLQLALIVFLAGLTILLWNLHNVVAAVETAFVGTLFLFLITVTILPAYRWDCCYRSPQALMVYTIVRAFRNRLTSALQRCIKVCSAHTSSKFLPARLWWSTLQKCCGMLSRTQTYRTWQAQERIDLRAQSEALNIETAVTAYTKTLDPASLDRMRIVLSGEPGRPLVRCLQALNIGANDGTVAPAALLKRNARGILSRLVLYALRQMLTVERKAREKGTRSGKEWENVLQMLLTVHTETLADGSIPRDELTLKTAFRILMEATSTTNQYSALRYLEAAVNIEAPTTCSYSTVWHVLSAAEQWIEKQQSLPDEPWISALPQINMYTFYIVVHCMLCVMQGKTTVPAPEETHFHNLCERAKAALCSLPKFLPVGSALVDHQTGHALCDQLSFGLQLLLAPLTLLSTSMDAPDPQFRNAYKLVGAPSVIETEVVAALEQVWETARVVLELPPRSDVEESKAGLGITTRLTALRTDVGSLFMSFGLVLSG